MAYAYTSGTANTLLAAIVQMMGEDAGFDYIAGLDRNVHHYNQVRIGVRDAGGFWRSRCRE